MERIGDRVGQHLDNYRLTRLLGRGGFADVYLAEHLHLGTQAAIKVLSTRLTNDDEEHFRNEARTIAHLKHPHIISVLDFGFANNTPYLVMEYAPHGTLRQCHPKGTCLPLEIIVSYVKQVAEALLYAHQHKLIHRDIKPENLLLGYHQEVLLSDFGIAVIAQSSHHQERQGMAGTVAYMAPEQLQGKPQFSSDQYALGIVVYEWLCGERPFQGSFTEVATQHLLASPPSLREKVPTIPAAVEEVVMTALAKDPHQRFSNIQAFAHALELIYKPEVSSLSHPTAMLPQPLGTSFSHVSAPALSKSLSTPPERDRFSLSLSSVSTPLDPSPSLNRSKRHISRRVIVFSLVGLVTASVVGSSITWLARSSRPRIPSPSTPIPLGKTLFTYRGHSDAVSQVVWSPNDMRIASGSGDKTVQVWDAATGGHVFTYHGHSTVVSAVAWSPNGMYIASGSFDKTVRVWNAATGNTLFTYHGHASNQNGLVNTIAWSPDGKRIASGSTDTTVQVWDASTGNTLFTYHGHSTSPSNFVFTIAWSPDSKRIASGGADKTVQVWDAASGNTFFTYHGHSDFVNTVAWSPGGKHLASGGNDKTVQIWDAATGSALFTYHGHSDLVNTVTWSPDSKRIASGGDDKMVQIWNAIAGNTLFTYYGHSDYVTTVAWSPNGKHIASGSGSKDTTVQVWQAI